ncbi:MAG: hypothetical protein ACREP9_08390 [Candidatus Dormibacteraceae bacterium]
MRILWTTILAIKGAEGMVEMNVRGLARRANLTVAETKEALAFLESPDEDSTSTEHEGRRLEKVPTGWKVLNHTKYQEKVRELWVERRRAQNAAAQRRRREKLKLKEQYPAKHGGGASERQGVKEMEGEAGTDTHG